MSEERSWSFRAFFGANLVVFTVVALAPAAVMLALSFWMDGGLSLAAYRGVLAEPRQWELLGNSLTIAFGTALLSTFIGAPAGFAFAYFQVRGRGLLALGMAVPLLAPPYVFAMSWVDLLGKTGLVNNAVSGLFGTGPVFNVFGPAGAVFVLSMSYYPVVMLATALCLHRFDSRLEEAALLFMPRWRAVAAVTVPLLAPGILAGSLVVFMLALTGFSVPSLLQVKVYTVEIFSRFSTEQDFRGGMAQAVPLAGIGLLAAFLWSSRLKKAGAWLTGSRRPVRPPRGRAVRTAAALSCFLLVLISAALPLAALTWRALPLESFFIAFRTAGDEVAASLLISTAAAALVCVLTLCGSFLEREGGLARLYRLSVVPFMASGPVLGIGLVLMWNHSGLPALVYDSFVIIILACAARYLVLAHEGLGASIQDLHPGQEEAATVAGASWWARFTGVVVPHQAPALVGAFGVTFVLSLAELDAVLLVYPPGWTPLSVRLFSLMHYGPSQTVAALGLLVTMIVLASAAVLAAAWLSARRMFHARG